MSPSESQLRAALHDGEGAGVDPDAVISHAIGVRRDRRRRINAIAGGVAVVAVIGVGASVLSSSSNGRNGGSSADSAAGGAASRNGTAAAPRRPVSSATAAGGLGRAPAVAGTCPTAPDHFALPGGGGSGQFGSTDPLFPASVTSIRVCGYPLLASAGTRTIVLSGAEAQSLASSINASSTKAMKRLCPANTNFVGGTLELYAVDGQGNAVDPVVVTLECVASQATNGTGVRYLVSLPDNLLSLLRVIPDRVQGPSGPLQGSPVH
jgi:hypothetical protein